MRGPLFAGLSYGNIAAHLVLWLPLQVAVMTCKCVHKCSVPFSRKIPSPYGFMLMLGGLRSVSLRRRAAHVHRIRSDLTRAPARTRWLSSVAGSRPTFCRRLTGVAYILLLWQYSCGLRHNSANAPLLPRFLDPASHSARPVSRQRGCCVYRLTS
jgi:hypothetical protein